MKVYNEKINKKSSIIENSLSSYRKIRNFNPKEYIEKKVELINNYFNQSRLDTAVIALSGGIDSAIVFAILDRVKKSEKTNLKNIIPVTLPAISNTGVTNQDSSRSRAEELTNKFNYKLLEIDLSEGAKLLGEKVEKQLEVIGGDWAKGQYVPYLRTSTLYYFTSLLSQKGNRSVLVGTTNADEGQYLGYIGKASDGMVDIQPISDLHKSEIYLLAEYLELPQNIITVKPTGDMYDGRTDEEVFGTSYDNVEFYYYFMTLEKEIQLDLIEKFKKENQYHVFEELQRNIENLHMYNLHKYIGCSPAVHLDIMPMRIKGGWKYFNYGEVSYEK